MSEKVFWAPIYLVIAAAIFAITLSLQSCARGEASGGVTAEVVASPVAGYRCFVIKDGGATVGGNCVRE